MAQTKILIDNDLATGEIARIIHPDDDSELIHHPPQPQHGWGQVIADHKDFPLSAEGRPLYDLHHCRAVVRKATGK